MFQKTKINIAYIQLKYKLLIKVIILEHFRENKMLHNKTEETYIKYKDSV